MFPSALKWLLLLQAPAAGVTISASVLIFGARAVPSALAVVAAVLHFLLGLYSGLSSCAAPSRPGCCYVCCVYVVPCCLVIVCAGLWCGPLCYFAERIAWPRVGQLGSASSREDAEWPRLSMWTKGGCAMSVASMSVSNQDGSMPDEQTVS
ncbi:hypothetical protein VTH06DRAFT_2011 [Thermothelomyces fergusii]